MKMGTESVYSNSSTCTQSWTHELGWKWDETVIFKSHAIQSTLYHMLWVPQNPYFKEICLETQEKKYWQRAYSSNVRHLKFSQQQLWQHTKGKKKISHAHCKIQVLFILRVNRDNQAATIFYKLRIIWLL